MLPAQPIPVSKACSGGGCVKEAHSRVVASPLRAVAVGPCGTASGDTSTRFGCEALRRPRRERSCGKGLAAEGIVVTLEPTPTGALLPRTIEGCARLTTDHAAEEGLCSRGAELERPKVVVCTGATATDVPAHAVATAEEDNFSVMTGEAGTARCRTVVTGEVAADRTGVTKDAAVGLIVWRVTEQGETARTSREGIAAGLCVAGGT